jgi:LmbE family N-acetylglucosaminyl deacetylase
VSGEARTGPALGCFAHPDDAEIAAGGTLSKWAAAGREVHLLILTNGDRGSQDRHRDRAELAETRAAEARDAAAFLSLASVTVLANRDGELENTPAVRDRVVRAVRTVRPDVVVTVDPTAVFFDDGYYNHADHRTAGWITLDAVFPAAGNPHFFAEQLDEGLEPWDVPEVWLAWTREPNHDEDVTGHMERKLAALALHRSQVEGDMLGYFEEWLPKEAEEAGRRIGVEHAEAFRVLGLTA